MSWTFPPRRGLGAALALCVLGCGASGEPGAAALEDGPYASGSDGELLDDPASSAGAPDDALGLGQRFRQGINGGFPNSGWNDPILAGLEARAGCNSQRLSLPEQHLDRWGYGIELGDMDEYEALGLSAQVAFLSAPIRAHSSAPAGTDDGDLTRYPPRNLYEPILLDDGTINPDNYWGKYVFDTVSTYRDHVKIWEIWNEPDFVDDGSVTLEWDARAPTASDLVRFGGSIYDYVRMLRVSKIAAQLADPEAKIATGGIGYASFLGALLRATDNPAGGAVTERYPLTGGAYFDVLSFHHYPIYAAGNSDAAVRGYLEHRDALAAELDAAGAHVTAWETTESGAPRVAIGDYPGGPAYARNYLMKLRVVAQAAGVDGIDWFVLSDSAAPDEADDPYSVMGLYEDVSDLERPEDAVLTDTGVASATLGSLLGGARVDPDATAALALPDSVHATAFVTRDDVEALALWALTDDDDDTPTVEVRLDGAWQVYAWDHSRTGEVQVLGEGEPLALSSAVTILRRE